MSNGPEQLICTGFHRTEGEEYKPVIDRRYPFAQIAEAHRYVDTGRKKGNVVIHLSMAINLGTPIT